MKTVLTSYCLGNWALSCYLECWETELFQLTDKGTGAFISQLPIHHWLRVESRGLDLLAYGPNVFPQPEKGPSA